MGSPICLGRRVGYGATAADQVLLLQSDSYIGFTQGNRALTLVCSWDQMNGQLFHMTSIFGDQHFWTQLASI